MTYASFFLGSFGRGGLPVAVVALRCDRPFLHRRKDSLNDFLNDFLREIGVSPAPERSKSTDYIQITIFLITLTRIFYNVTL